MFVSLRDRHTLQVQPSTNCWGLVAILLVTRRRCTYACKMVMPSPAAHGVEAVFRCLSLPLVFQTQSLQQLNHAAVIYGVVIHCGENGSHLWYTYSHRQICGH